MLNRKKYFVENQETGFVKARFKTEAEAVEYVNDQRLAQRVTYNGRTIYEPFMLVEINTFIPILKTMAADRITTAETPAELAQEWRKDLIDHIEQWAVYLHDGYEVGE